MVDDATAVAEPTEAPVETPTEVVDAPESAAPEAVSAEEPAAPEEVVEQPPAESEATFTKADLESRVGTEIANQRQKWESESATATKAAAAEAVDAYKAATDRERGNNAAIEAVWTNAAQKIHAAGGDLRALKTSDPAAFQEIALAFNASTNYGAVAGSQQAREWMTKNHTDLPADVVAKATELSQTDPGAAVSTLFDAAVESRANQIVTERTEAIQTEANARVEAEHNAAEAKAIPTAPATPPGAYTSGVPTMEQYVAASDIQMAEWIRDGIEPVVEET